MTRSFYLEVAHLRLHDPRSLTPATRSVYQALRQAPHQQTMPTQKLIRRRLLNQQQMIFDHRQAVGERTYRAHPRQPASPPASSDLAPGCMSTASPRILLHQLLTLTAKHRLRLTVTYRHRMHLQFVVGHRDENFWKYLQAKRASCQ